MWIDGVYRSVTLSLTLTLYPKIVRNVPPVCWIQL